MAELPDNKNQEESSSYTPASPVKRIIAWVGVTYMLIFVASQPLPLFPRRRLPPGAGPPAGLPRCRRSGGDCRLAVPPAGVHLLQKGLHGPAVGGLRVILVIGLVQGVPALLAGLGV